MVKKIKKYVFRKAKKKHVVDGQSGSSSAPCFITSGMKME